MKLPTTTVEKVDHAKAGSEIRRLRVAAGISLRRLALLLQVSAPFLSDMELGKRGWSPERFEQAQKQIKQTKL
jgi:transcriptional regulator with XRE-family HTH domain